MSTQLYRPVPVPRKFIELMCDPRTAISPLAKIPKISPEKKKRLIAEYIRARNSYYASLREPIDIPDLELVFPGITADHKGSE